MFERKKPSGKLLSLPIDQIHPSPFQARKSFDEQELTALAQSIRENGLLQPVTVRRAAEGYELVAGERRLRACQLAKMTTIPAILCSYADDRTAALGLLENIQRADLNPFEQAQGLRDVMVLWDCTQAEAAKRLGMAQPTLANKLRLLKLPREIRELVQGAALSAGHARALLAIRDPALQMDTAKRAADGKLTVRDIEKIAAAEVQAAQPEKPADAMPDSYFTEMQISLESRLARRVSVTYGKNKGSLVLEFYDKDDLAALAQKLTRE